MRSKIKVLSLGCQRDFLRHAATNLAKYEKKTSKYLMENFNLEKRTLTSGPFTVNALAFIPERPKTNFVGVFTHGYTASKSSLLTWGSRLAASGFSMMIFDLPGHYLGSYNEVESLQDFTNYSPLLFHEAKKYLEEMNLLTGDQTLILGGHSLGALMSLKALETDLNYQNVFNICVGYGLGPQETIHAFDSDFYKKTFEFREQLVSEPIRGNKILPWIKSQKESMNISNHEIHLITGKDDIVVASDGSERLQELLQDKGNDVSLIRPNRMSHHQPELAGPHIMAILREKLKSQS